MHRPRKRFGQNFLHDEVTLQRIVAAIRPQSTESILEIGPGQGALTATLLEVIPHLYAIELDRDLVARLQQRFSPSQLTLTSGDALQLKLDDWPTPLRIVGNLPYNIATPLIFHLLNSAERITDMHFMVQQEVADRLAAPPDCKDYGRLSVMVQYHCQVTQLLQVPPEAFYPAPKVDSAVVRLKPHSVKPATAHSRSQLEQVTQLAFSQRRKTLRNTLRPLFSGEALTALGINPTLRAENLTLVQFVTLANAITPLPAPASSHHDC